MKDNNKENQKIFPFITGKTINLCPRTSEHAHLYTKWRNDPKVRIFSRNIIPRTIDHQKKRLETRNGRTPENISFEIWHVKDKVPIGTGGLNHIDWINGWANAHLTIGEPEYWGQNIATEAVELIAEYAFNELNLNKLHGGAAVDNIGSWTVAEKIGFVFEGIRKHKMYVDGKYIDVKTYRLLKEDWLKRKKSTNS